MEVFPDGSIFHRKYNPGFKINFENRTFLYHNGKEIKSFSRLCFGGEGRIMERIVRDGSKITGRIIYVRKENEKNFLYGICTNYKKVITKGQKPRYFWRGSEIPKPSTDCLL